MKFWDITHTAQSCGWNGIILGMLRGRIVQINDKTIKIGIQGNICTLIFKTIRTNPGFCPGRLLFAIQNGRH